MTLREIYEFAIRKGFEVDPRGKEALEAKLAGLRKDYEAMSEADREVFDEERLTNPFGDTRIVCGDPDREVKRAMVGIDIHGQEILAAKILSARGTEIDAIIAHHATELGRPLASVFDAMESQVPMMAEVGVPRHVAEKLVKEEAADRDRGENYRHVALADLLGIGIVGIHSTPDNYCLKHLQMMVADEKPRTVSDLVDLLRTLPESKDSSRKGVPPKAVVGGGKDLLGDRVYYCVTGGWNPSARAFQKLADAGVGTVVMIVATEDHKKIARESQMNVVRFPHYASDSLGINLMLDDMLAESPMEIVPCSNFVRVSRYATPCRARAPQINTDIGG